MTLMLAPPSGTSPTNDRASASVLLQSGGLADVHVVLLKVPHRLRSVTLTSAVGDVCVSIPDDTSWAMHAMQYSGHQNLVYLLLEPRP